MDIQLAARGVAEENQRLREENGRLREEGEKLRGENERMRGILDRGDEQERAKASNGGEYVAAGASLHGVETVEPEDASSRLQESTDRDVKESTPTTGSEEIYTQPKPPPEVSRVGQNVEMVLGDDTSSCEYAAHIITGMRADISADDVRADLGCGGDIREWRKCKVDNSKLFVAMDRYTR